MENDWGVENMIASEGQYDYRDGELDLQWRAMWQVGRGSVGITFTPCYQIYPSSTHTIIRFIGYWWDSMCLHGLGLWLQKKLARERRIYDLCFCGLCLYMIGAGDQITGAKRFSMYRLSCLTNSSIVCNGRLHIFFPTLNIYLNILGDRAKWYAAVNNILSAVLF